MNYTVTIGCVGHRRIDSSPDAVVDAVRVAAYEWCHANGLPFAGYAIAETGDRGVVSVDLDAAYSVLTKRGGHDFRSRVDFEDFSMLCLDHGIWHEPVRRERRVAS